MTTRSQSGYLVLSVALLLLWGFTGTKAQSPMFRVPVFVDYTSYYAPPFDTLVKKVRSDTVYFGVHPLAQFCLDPTTLTGFTDHWVLRIQGVWDDQTVTEAELPPAPPTFEVRMKNARGTCPAGQTSLGLGVKTNIHPYVSSSQIDTFRVVYQPDPADTAFGFKFHWPSVLSTYCTAMRIQDPTATISVDMNAQSSMVIDQATYTALTGGGGAAGLFSVIMTGPKVPPLPPATLQLVAPANGAVDQALNNLRFSWLPAANAQFYEYMVSTDSTFTSVILYDSVKNDTVGYAKTLQPFTRYFWRAVVYNTFGYSLFQSPAYSFRTQGPPSPPTLLAPANGQANSSLTPTLLWSSSVSTVPVTYHLQIATDNGFSSIVKDTSLADTTAQVGPLQHCGTYYWHVFGVNAFGTGATSSAFNFKTSMATPSTPVLSLPADGAVNVLTSPTLTWINDPCSELYRVQLARDTGFTNLVSSLTVNRASTVVGPLGQDSTYYWRVRGVNSLPDSSQFSVFRTFTTRLDPAAAPLLVSPAAGDTTQPDIDTLRWRTAPYATSYRVQLARDQNFTNIIIDDSTLVDTLRQVGPLDHCSVFYWRASSKNASGSAGFSTLRIFRVRTYIPGPPTLLTPVNNKDSLQEITTLTWAGDACTQSYFYHVALSNSFTDTVASGAVSQATVTIGPLPGNTVFFWRVAGVNGLGRGTFSTAFQFKTTPLTTPPIPVLRYPGNGAGDLPVALTLQWDSSARANSYRVQLALDTAFSILKVNDSTVTQHSRAVSSLLNSTTYFWRVNAKNTAGTSVYSPTWRFFTLYPPDSSVLINPVYAASGVSITPEFDWSLAQRADAYWLQVAKDTIFSKLVFNDSTISVTSWRLLNPLDGITKYYWRVRGYNSVGWGPWSYISWFVTTRTGVADWVIPLTIAETGPARDIVYFGLNPYATAGIDPALGEYELPPVQPGFFDTRFISPYIGQGLRLDLLPFRTYAQTDTFQVEFQPGIGSYPMTLSWPKAMIQSVCDSMVIQDQLGAPTISKRMNVDTSIVVNNSSIHSLTIVKYGAFPLPLGVRPVSPQLPKGFVLYQNYPNPFNPTTHIAFSTDRSAMVRITVYDILGQVVATLANGSFFPGQYMFEWAGTNESGVQMPSGVYYVRMVASSVFSEGAAEAPYTSIRKMLMLK